MYKRGIKDEFGEKLRYENKVRDWWTEYYKNLCKTISEGVKYRIKLQNGKVPSVAVVRRERIRDDWGK